MGTETQNKTPKEELRGLLRELLGDGYLSRLHPYRTGPLKTVYEELVRLHNNGP